MPGETPRLVSLSGKDSARHIPAVAEWVLDAGNPHLEWLYMGDRERALTAIRFALASPRSELWMGHVTALLDEGQAVGGFLGLPGKELADRRKADLAALIRATNQDERAELRRRVGLGKDVYAPVEPDHWFLSKIGLLPAYRSRGLGAFLLDAFITASWEKGYRHIRLDVARGDGRIVRFYESRGFRTLESRTLSPLNVDYLAMTLTRPGDA